MKPGLSKKIRSLMDNCLPPVLRDSRWFMSPLLRIWFGRNYTLIRDFTRNAYQLSEEEFARVYATLNSSHATDRPTDLTGKSLSWIDAALDSTAHSLLDVGCGRGFFAERIRSRFDRVAASDVVPELAIPGVEYTKA